MSDPRDIVERVRSVVRREPVKVGLHDARMPEASVASASDALRNCTGTAYLDRFEQLLGTVTCAESVIATSSGTAALHLALLAAGVVPGDEVLVPSLTFVATANAVAYCGATPNFVDGCLTVHPNKLRCYLARETRPSPDKVGRINKKTGNRVRAIVPVHLLGAPADMSRIMLVAQEFGITVVEDAAEALGTVVEGKQAGTLGIAGVLSFNYNKVVTTCGGGAVLTSEPWVAARVLQLATVARLQHDWLVEHSAVGFNYRMSNLAAAVGLPQLEQLDEIISGKLELAGAYRAAFDGCVGARYVDPDPRWFSGRSNHWLNVIEVDEQWRGGRDAVLAALHAQGLLARAVFTPLYKLPMYAGCPRDEQGYAEVAAERYICLPSGLGLARQERRDETGVCFGQQGRQGAAAGSI